MRNRRAGDWIHAPIRLPHRRLLPPIGRRIGSASSDASSLRQPFSTDQTLLNSIQLNSIHKPLGLGLRCSDWNYDIKFIIFALYSLVFNFFYMAPFY